MHYFIFLNQYQKKKVTSDLVNTSFNLVQEQMDIKGYNAPGTIYYREIINKHVVKKLTNIGISSDGLRH